LKLFLASTNPGKMREFCQSEPVSGISIELVPNLYKLAPCLEDGATFEENARKKALHYSAHIEGAVIGEDSGLSVDALEESPGVYSARYAGAGASDSANNKKLLWEMRSFEAARRSAHYVCVIALAERGRILTVAQGHAHGLILEEPRGSGGFGYDPLFYYPPLDKTFAELTPDEKFRVSHRGEAFRKLLEYLGRTR